MKKYVGRVHFYSPTDMAAEMMLGRAEDLLVNFSESKQYSDINDIIELYHIKQYIDAKLFLANWSEQQRDIFSVKTSGMWSAACKFFNNINDSNVSNYLTRLDARYRDSFWELFAKCKTYKNVTKEKIRELLNIKASRLRTILRQDVLVRHYDKPLREHFISTAQTAEIILLKYEGKRDLPQKTMHLPPSLTKEDKIGIISNYIDHEDANANYIRLIVSAREQADFKIHDTIRLKAKRRHEAIMRELLTSESAMTLGYNVVVSKEQIEPKTANYEDGKLTVTYSLTWIQQHADVVSLFKNFVDLLGFLDGQHRISLVSLKSQKSFVDIFGVDAEGDYPNHFQFQSANNLAFVQIIAYEHILKDIGISLDDVITTAFNNFTAGQGIDGLSVKLPSPSASTLEKIRFLLPEMEALMKKYKLYVEHGKIDPELLSISSAPCKIKEIPSGVNKKYVYGVDENIGLVQYFFFSDQSMLFYVPPFKDQYQSLFDLIVNEKVLWSNVEEYQKDGYNTLTELGYLKIVDGYIELDRINDVCALGDLHKNDVMSYGHYRDNARATIDQLARADAVVFESTLLSNPEIDYFNYYLNRSEFTNGADLRNKYVHGAHLYDEGTMKADYYRLLILLVLLEWKIIDDICITKLHEDVNK